MSLNRGSRGLDGLTSDREYDRLFRVLFEETHDFALLLEASGLIVQANEQVFRFTGANPGEIIGTRIWETPWFRTSSESEHRLREDLQRAVGGDRVDVEYLLQGANRSAVVDTSIRPVPTTRGSTELLLVTGEETTDQHRRISKLETQQDCLQEFVRVLTHDIRGLLDVATGNLELAAGDDEEAELETAKHSLDRIERLLDHCSETIRDGELIGERVPLNLAGVANEAWQHIETPEASLTVESSTTIRADRTRLMEVFENLYRNAVEHTGPDITVRVGTTDEGFYIEDDGSGLPDGKPLFEPGVSTASDGSGLGLAIVETVVEAHGWSINTAEGSQGGARFEIQTEDDTITDLA